MFTVKAEIRDTDGSGVRASRLFSAERVYITPPKYESTPPPKYNADFEVWLMDQTNNVHEVLPVSDHLGDYCAVFIMNEKGKTVERIMASSKPS